MAGIFSKFSNASMRPYLMGLQLQSSVYGVTVPQIYGRTRVPLYLTWANGMRKVETSSKPWWGYLFTGIGLLLWRSKEFYLENVTFLGGHNPIWGPLQAWAVDTKIPLDFLKSSIAISPGDATIVIPGADAGAAYPIALTLTLPYSETFDDYGGFGPATFSGTYELPVWNGAKAGPDPTDASAYRAWPYVFRNVPGVGPTFYLDQNAIRTWPACTANLYYALRSNSDLANPVASLALTFEPELGDGPEYGSTYVAQQILYPHYAGLGSDGLLLTAGLGMPNIRVELQGAFGVYGTGDADFADMIEDIFKGAQVQGGAGTTRARTDVQHGLGCYDYPGLVQKMIFQPGTAPALLSRANWSISADSDFGSGYVASKAIDGNLATQWASANTALPHYLIIDLGAAYPVNYIEVWPRQDGFNGQHPTTIELYVSDDGMAWGSVVATITGLPATAAVVPWVLPTTFNYRYLKLNITAVDTGTLAAIAEVYAGLYKTFPVGTKFTYDRAIAAGDFLVVFASSAVSASLGISDDAGNSWTPIFSGPLPYQGWYATAVSYAPGNRVTITGLGASPNVIILEVGGVDALDAIATAASSSATASCSITSTNAGGVPAFILAWTNIDVGETVPTLAPGRRWPTLITGLDHQWVQGRAVWFPGTYTISNAGVTPDAWRMAVLVFKASQPPSYPKPLGGVLDQTTLALTRDQCRAYGLYGSASLDSQKKALDWLVELYQAANAAAVWSGFRLKSVPYAEASVVGNGAVYRSPTSVGPVAQLGPCDFVGDASRPMIVVERKAQVDTPNILQMQHPNRDSDYNHVVTAQTEQSSLSLYGPRKQSPRVFMWVQDSGMARMLLGVEARRLNYLRNVYKFTLNAKHKLLEPMDLVEITDPLAGIAAVPVRLIKIVENADYDLDCEAKDFIYGAESPSITQNTGTAPNSNPVPSGAVPASVNVPAIFQPVVRLSGQQSQVWFVVSDPDVNYGGCLVYVSTDGGASYQPFGVINGNGVTGITVGTWAAGADPDTTHDLALDLTESLGDLLSYNVNDEDNFVYPCYVAGGAGAIPYELMAYAVADLTSAYHYNLKATGGGGNHLRRAVFGAPTVGAGVSHAGGSRFAFLDPAGKGMMKATLDPAWVGKTLYFKFPAFNQFSGGVQPLAGLTAYPFTPYDLGDGGPNPNNTDYTVDPCPCLSQPAGTLNVVVEVTTAHFPTNDAAYAGRTFTVADPGGPVATIPSATMIRIINVVQEVGGLQTYYCAEPHGLTDGVNVFYSGYLRNSGGVFLPAQNGSSITVVDTTTFTVQAASNSVAAEIYGGAVIRGIMTGYGGGMAAVQVAVGQLGSGYVVNDIVNVQSTPGLPTDSLKVKVTSVDGGGGVTGLSIYSQRGYPIYQWWNFPCMGGSGTGLYVDVMLGALQPGQIGPPFLFVTDINDTGVRSGNQFVIEGCDDPTLDGIYTCSTAAPNLRYLYAHIPSHVLSIAGSGTLHAVGTPIPPPIDVAISSMSRTSFVMTIVTATDHGLSTGNCIYINGGDLDDGVFSTPITVTGLDSFTYESDGANGSGGASGRVQRGLIRRSDTVYLYDIPWGMNQPNGLVAGVGNPCTVFSADDSGFDGSFIIIQILTSYSIAHGYVARGVAWTQTGADGVSGNGIVTAGSVGAGGTAPYYVTIYDPGFVGDAQGARPAYCETTQAKVGIVGYTLMGSIYVTHIGGDVLVTCGGWPPRQEYLINGQ